MEYRDWFSIVDIEIDIWFVLDIVNFDRCCCFFESEDNVSIWLS